MNKTELLHMEAKYIFAFFYTRTAGLGFRTSVWLILTLAWKSLNYA